MALRDMLEKEPIPLSGITELDYESPSVFSKPEKISGNISRRHATVNLTQPTRSDNPSHLPSQGVPDSLQILQKEPRRTQPSIF